MYYHVSWPQFEDIDQSMDRNLLEQCQKYMNYHVTVQMSDGAHFDGIIDDFDDEGITYTKTGTKIDYYNRSLDEYSKEKNFSSDGLNEGITELLASIITKEYTGNYAPYVVISKLFMNNNNYLLNAYFDDNISEFEKFYKDVEEKQSLVTREDFKILTSKCTDYEMTSKIIVAGIKYCKSNGQEISDEELNLMINYLDNNLMLDSGSWYDLISENVSKLK